LFFRPVKWEAIPKFAGITLMSATDPQFKLSGWNTIQKDFFSDGGIFDRAYQS
jgi:ABC-type sulfate transport system substrate-binding protein